MSRKELTKTFMMISNRTKPFVLHGLNKNNLTLIGLRTTCSCHGPESVRVIVLPLDRWSPCLWVNKTSNIELGHDKWNAKNLQVGYREPMLQCANKPLSSCRPHTLKSMNLHGIIMMKCIFCWRLKFVLLGANIWLSPLGYERVYLTLCNDTLITLSVPKGGYATLERSRRRVRRARWQVRRISAGPKFKHGKGDLSPLI